jgi:WD40 repeat protein
MIRIFESGKLVNVLNPHQQELVEVCPFTSIDFDPTGLFFAVTDVKGYCSVWSIDAPEKPIEMFELLPETMYGVSFVTRNVIGVVSETGKFFVIDRRTKSAVCTENEETVPACQPRLLAWDHLSTKIAIGNQISGNFSIFQQKSISDELELVGSSRKATSIADIKWAMDGEFLIVARDCGLVEVWNGRGSLDAPLYESRSPGVGSIGCLGMSVLIGTTDGNVNVSKLPELDKRRRSGALKFDDSPHPDQRVYPALQ